MHTPNTLDRLADTADEVRRLAHESLIEARGLTVEVEHLKAAVVRIEARIAKTEARIEALAPGTAAEKPIDETADARKRLYLALTAAIAGFMAAGGIAAIIRALGG